ncbi:hypothetical protein SteCoe_14027 [Stentor coeruleus]|uniref:Uncharacterized protein n=1 Tax=Stentor coeruleus TaxID=5963 RepID=A0A1R2C6X3_9CILI|nr:hypothetical protein SteCoe_14027 [Stentor coeruleus]
MDLLDISSIEGSQNSIFNSVEDHGREILIITIDIGHGKTEEIVLREFDTPKFVAKEFCRKHKLNPEAEKVIIDVIKEHINIKPTIEVSMMAEQSTSKVEKSSESFHSKSKLEDSKKLNSFHTKEDLDIKDEKAITEPEPLKVSKISNKPNFGERMYHEALINKEKREKKVNEMREKIIKEKMKESTFRPNITPNRKMPRLQLLQSESPEKPVDRCHLLYNKSQKSSSASQSPTKLVNNSPTVSQKTINSRKNLQLYLEQKEQMERKPRRAQSPTMLSREKLRKNYRPQSQEQKVKLSNEQTDKILNRIKTIRFVQLFEILNPNENQEIDKNTVLAARVPKNIAKLLWPFMEELKKIPHGLNLDQFCKVMELYIKEMTPEERSSLLQIGKRRPSPGGNRGVALHRDFVNDLWSPKHEEKLLAFDRFPEYTEKD